MAEGQTLTGVGRTELEQRLRASDEERARLAAKLEKQEEALYGEQARVRFLERQVKELQERGNQLLEDARASKRRAEGLDIALDMNPLADLLRALQYGRQKYPEGVTLLSVLDEAGEMAHAANKGEPDKRIREEALDTAVVALRYYLGEIVRRDEGILLRGWTCGHCRVFNGEERERLTSCRSCGRAKEA